MAKEKKHSMIPFILYFIAYAIVIVLDVFTKETNQYLSWLKNLLMFLLTLHVIGVFAQLLKVLRPILSKWCKNWSAVIWTVAITFATPIAIHFWVYGGESINQDTLLSVYTEYLSFVGAFALGYFLYRREVIKNEEVLKKKARLMYDSMLHIQIGFRSIDTFIERGETYPIPEKWRSDYLDIKHLITYNESSLYSELQYFFNSVGAINKAIVAGDKQKAKKLYLRFEENEKYSASEYNYMEAESVLLSISHDIPQVKPWKEEEKKQIEAYADSFFAVVNHWIYNYLKKHHLSSCDAELIEHDLVEWLLHNPELRAWVKHPYEKRKITAMVFNIALAMNEKSTNLNYCWREFSLR